MPSRNWNEGNNSTYVISLLPGFFLRSWLEQCCLIRRWRNQENKIWGCCYSWPWPTVRRLQTHLSPLCFKRTFWKGYCFSSSCSTFHREMRRLY